jgi:very-short-patch-repair endonuclease
MDFATTAQLRAGGMTRRDIGRAITNGELRRVRRGRYTTLQPDDERVIAARVGGQLTGVSAIAALGGWLPRHPRVIHVAVPRTHSRLRREASRIPVIVHWVDRPASEAPIADLTEVLIRVALDEDLETVVSCFDWAFASASVDVIDFERILNALPIRARVLRSWVDPGSQSILESVARVRILRRGWSVRSQVRVGDVQAIDLVIEEHVALELDGREHHALRFEADRRKDLAITREGRHSIRLTASMLWDQWAEVELAIEAALFARRVSVPNAGNAPAAPRGSKAARRPRR